MRAKNSEVLRKTVISAMFLALATIFNILFSFYLPIYGANGIRVGFSGVFTVFPAVLFGPVYGAAVGGLTDFLTWALRPDGAYIPPLTLTAALGGFIQGLLWRAVRKKTDTSLRTSTACVFTLIGIYGIVTHIALNNDGLMNGILATSATALSKEAVDSLASGGGLSLPSSLLVALMQYAKPEDYADNFALFANIFTIGLEFISLIGVAIMSIDVVLRKRMASKNTISDNSAQPFRFVFVMLIPGLIITTLNTPILQFYIRVLSDKAFILFLIPRIIEEVIVRTIQAYIASALYVVYFKTIKLKITKISER